MLRSLWAPAAHFVATVSQLQGFRGCIGTVKTCAMISSVLSCMFVCIIHASKFQQDGPANSELVWNKTGWTLNSNCSVEFRTVETTYDFALFKRFGSHTSLHFYSMGNIAAITKRLVFKRLDFKWSTYCAVIWRGKGPVAYFGERTKKRQSVDWLDAVMDGNWGKQEMKRHTCSTALCVLASSPHFCA